MCIDSLEDNDSKTLIPDSVIVFVLIQTSLTRSSTFPTLPLQLGDPCCSWPLRPVERSSNLSNPSSALSKSTYASCSTSPPQPIPSYTVSGQQLQLSTLAGGGIEVQWPQSNRLNSCVCEYQVNLTWQPAGSGSPAARTFYTRDNPFRYCPSVDASTAQRPPLNTDVQVRWNGDDKFRSSLGSLRRLHNLQTNSYTSAPVHCILPLFCIITLYRYTLPQLTVQEKVCQRSRRRFGLQQQPLETMPVGALYSTPSPLLSIKSVVQKRCCISRPKFNPRKKPLFRWPFTIVDSRSCLPWFS